MSGKTTYKPCQKVSPRICRGAIVIAIGFILLFPSIANAQCSGFARAVSKPELSPYIHDGNLNATILGEGETIILRKTVFKGQKYRLLVKGVPDLPPIRFRVLYLDQELFDNANHDFASKWDFTAEVTRTISVEVTIQEDDDPDTLKGGCVAVLIGIDPN
ncbi:hypothetical protein ACT29H_14105 [Thermophagus sp. OGC60D27]|uniref:hypothetical protein n=1 Tax=Thermophagus sp. OGC60D27 TaxID=3458415 RepID=UPI004037C3EA